MGRDAFSSEPEAGLLAGESHPGGFEENRQELPQQNAQGPARRGLILAKLKMSVRSKGFRAGLGLGLSEFGFRSTGPVKILLDGGRGETGDQEPQCGKTVSLELRRPST